MSVVFLSLATQHTIDVYMGTTSIWLIFNTDIRQHTRQQRTHTSAQRFHLFLFYFYFFLANVLDWR